MENKEVIDKPESISQEFCRIDRRTFIKMAALTAGAVAFSKVGFIRSAFAQVPQTPLPGNRIPQFVDPLPDLHAILAGTGQIKLQMSEFQYNMMPSTFVPAAGQYTGTWVWGYLEQGRVGNSAAIPSYIGPVILAKRFHPGSSDPNNGSPTEIKWVNNLGTTGVSIVDAYTKSTDQTLHWADPKMEMPQMNHYAGPIPTVPHLHGGEVPPQLDGGPDAWFLSSTSTPSNYMQKGHAYYTKNATDSINSAVYRYPNTQEAANIWFHDHTLGVTRLGVYAGLAGAYLISDPGLTLPTGLTPHGLGSTSTDPLFGDTPIIPLVIQDRMFDINGQLFFPNLPTNPLIHPFWTPEFVGDTIVVNGKVWPYKMVDRRRYRFLFLNGSNARAYDMSLIDKVSGVRGPRMWVIGTDGGYLDTPVLIDPNTPSKVSPKSLIVMPGERYDVIIDFNDQTWINLINAAYTALSLPVPVPLNLILQNTAKTPFPGGGPAPQSTTGRIMQFRVSANVPATDTSYNPARGVALRPQAQRIKRLVDPIMGTATVIPQVTRQLTLNEVMGLGGPLEVLVNNTKWGGHSIATDIFARGGIRPDFTVGPDGDTYYSELPNEGDTELWEIINLTADAHPIHLHLVQFQLMNRQMFDVAAYNAEYNKLFPGSSAIDPMTGAAFPPGVFIGGFGPPANYKDGKTLQLNSSGTWEFNGASVNTTAVGGNPNLIPFLNTRKWPVVPPLPHEAGWKDTVIAYPGQVTRIMVRWAPTDVPAGTTGAFPFDPNGGHGYVWHCHIIDHEDNEMMRPTSVISSGAARTYTDY